jgi:single-stranded-DNA-specific exonuclease
VIAIKDGIGKGSGRSVGGVALGAAIIAARQEGLLVNGGGHAMAAGFTVEEGKIGALREFLAARIEAAIGAETPTAQLTIDGAIAPLGATGELLALIEQLAPFGSGNPEPRLAIPAARILFAEPVGGAHVRCTVADAAGAGRLKAIAFRCLDNPLGAALLDRGGALLHLAGHLRADSWNGRTGVQFMIDDAAPVGPP